MGVGSSDAEGLGPTVGSGWGILMYPESLPAPLKTVLTFGWVAAMWLPAGLWARTRRDGLAIAAAAVAGLLGAPALLPLCPTPLPEGAAARHSGRRAGAPSTPATAAAGVQSRRAHRSTPRPHPTP